MRANIKRNEQRRVVVVGGGLGGLKMVSSLRDTDYQVVLVDKNNYNQFPPLIYQVASNTRVLRLLGNGLNIRDLTQEKLSWSLFSL